MKAREFERWLAQQGAVLEKKDGDHHVWRLPNGRRMDVPTGGKHAEAGTYLERRYHRLMAGGERSHGRGGS